MSNDDQHNSEQDVNTGRRRLVEGLTLLGGLAAAGSAPSTQAAGFPGEDVEHHVVYQLNHPEDEYHNHIVFSVGAMLRQYGDNIKVAVVAFGPGLHVLLKKPIRPVSKVVQEKIASLSQYGVDFYACGNTLASLKLTEKDVLPFAKVVQVGASTLMELQKQGYSYISW